MASKQERRARYDQIEQLLYQGLGFEEIARALNTSRSTVARAVAAITAARRQEIDDAAVDKARAQLFAAMNFCDTAFTECLQRYDLAEKPRRRAALLQAATNALVRKSNLIVTHCGVLRLLKPPNFGSGQPQCRRFRGSGATTPASSQTLSPAIRPDRAGRRDEGRHPEIVGAGRR